MSRLGFVFVLSLLACTDRGLDAAGIDTNLVTHDLAGTTTTNHSTDLAGQISVGDSDLGTITGGENGVPCGTATCTTDEVCCLSFLGAMCQMNGVMVGGCGTGAASFHCDGPEDCTMGQHCVAEGGGPTGPGGNTFILGTRCRGQMGGGMNGGSIVCHTAGDCPNGGTCTPGMNLPGAPPLSVCD